MDVQAIRDAVRSRLHADEASLLIELQEQARLDDKTRSRITDAAIALIGLVRADGSAGLMERFFAEYGLSTHEGVALMCLAEALLRVPDAATIDELIEDKIAPHDWGAHIGDSGSLLVNASVWALMLTGRVLDQEGDTGIVASLHGMLRRLGEPVIRVAVARAMQEMGAQFVLGQNIAEALAKGRVTTDCYSYDMLGEAAMTREEANNYHSSYHAAIKAIAKQVSSGDIRQNPGISVKLSALHPRYEYAQKRYVLPELADSLLQLSIAARDSGIGLNIDAEEAGRLDLSLDVFERVLREPCLSGWDGFGFVVQAYSRRAGSVIDWLEALSGTLKRRIMVRLVKGAYWDSEIKRAQIDGVASFPVFTCKAHTDVSYLACARKLLECDHIYPQFATHNAHSAAAVLAMAGADRQSFEFQRLYGMGQALHKILREREGVRCRVYAPVGAHEDLLAYLVRRLLENGANSSFVHQLTDRSVSAEHIARDPFLSVLGVTNPVICLPCDIYRPERTNSQGYDLTDPVALGRLAEMRAPFMPPWSWQEARGEGGVKIYNPAFPQELVGVIAHIAGRDVPEAVGRAEAAFGKWAGTSIGKRAEILCRAADLFEQHTGELLALLIREGGKTLADAIAELREAVDFLRYYAACSARLESGTVARGVIICISPWNFPLAIFTGQIAAALVSGNVVLAKPAEQTPLIAARAVALLHRAGIAEDILQLVPGSGETIGAALVADPHIAGVCFTGSTEIARQIDRQLAITAPDAILIAETGGVNAMIVDSTALPEQAVRDILASAFQSAGQRCSALRILYVQKDIEQKLLKMLQGAMDCLRCGDPADLSTDIGPVIDAESKSMLEAYIDQAKTEGRLIKQLSVPENGLFVGPALIKAAGIEQREIFGPVLHIASFAADEIDRVIDAINDTGYGLTFCLHSRIDNRVQTIIDRVRAGNIYVNRNQIGAVIGSQPFGGEGMSGTGPKAGGPSYLSRFRKRADAESVRFVGNILSGRATDRRDLLARLSGLPFELWSGLSKADRIAILAGLAPEQKSFLDEASLLQDEAMDLPGPVGESNRLRLVPRGTILCTGRSAVNLLRPLMIALATGNAALVICPDAEAVLQHLEAEKIPLLAINGQLSRSDVQLLPFAALCADKPDAELRLALSQRQGAILPLLAALDAPERFMHERAVCIDTTAAGGNTHLLALAG